MFFDQLLEKIFGVFAKLWMDMKIQAKTKEELASLDFKFRPRGFKIENVIEVDLSNLGNLLEGESFLEWQKLAAEEEDSVSVIYECSVCSSMLCGSI